MMPGPGDGENTVYLNAFPKVNPANANDWWYETEGAIGKHWTTAEMKYEDGIVYFYLLPDGSSSPPVLIGARTEDEVVSGHVMLGYSDLNNGTAAEENGGGAVGAHDANYVVFDNLLVERVTQTRQKWNHDGGGNWSEAGKWDNGQPDDETHVADFTTALTAPATVTVDGPREVRSIVFDSAQSYTVAGANAITIDSVTDGVFGTLKSRSGSHTISAPVTLNRPAIFDVSPGSQLALTNLNANGFRLVKNGQGTAVVNHLRAPRVDVNAGIMRVAPDSSGAGVSNIGSLTIGTNARLDLAANKLVTNTPVGTFTAGAYNGVHGEVQRAYHNGAWDRPGLMTSEPNAGPTVGTTTIGVATAQTILFIAPTATGTWAGQPVTGTTTLAMYTYAGDLNFDGRVDAQDYGIIDNWVQFPGTRGYANGDINYDGVIDAADYGIIDNTIQLQGAPIPVTGDVAAASLSGVAAVPEPASLSVLGFAAATLLGRRRRASGN
jgi:hypothetical protein